MGGLVILFPGQGAQKTGMGKDFYERYESAREIFDRANETLPELKLKELCFEGPDEELVKTEKTQPALYTVGFAVYRVLKEMGINGEIFGGHSLGEYTAVAAAGYMDFEEGLRLVYRRGILMRDCDPERKGGMAAIIGMDRETIEKVCKEIGGVFPANFNSPSQIVISGLKEKVEEASKRLKEMGAKRCVMLNVSGAFHSPFMAEVQKELEKALNSVNWRQGNGKIISNATAKLADSPEVIKENLLKQLSSPVLWSESMSYLVREGYKNYLECGPGGVLKGLFRSISREANVIPVGNIDDISRVEEFFQA